MKIENEHFNHLVEQKAKRENVLQWYKEHTDKLQNFVWVENYPSEVNFIQQLARAEAHFLGFNLWNTYPGKYN